MSNFIPKYWSSHCKFPDLQTVRSRAPRAPHSLRRGILNLEARTLHRSLSKSGSSLPSKNTSPASTPPTLPSLPPKEGSTLRRSAAAELFDRPNWTWTTLGEIAELKGGITKDSKREADPDYVEYPYLRVANVQRGFLDLSVVTTIRSRAATRRKSWCSSTATCSSMRAGTATSSGAAGCGRARSRTCIHQNHVFRARLTGGDFDPYFVSMHANTWGQQWFETHGKQTTNLASINLTTLKSFPVPAPSLEDQQAVVAELQSIAGAEHRLQADLDRAQGRSRTLRRSILAKAFTGQLVPQDPTDESASVLLDCIAASRSTKPNRRASARQVS